MKPAILIITLLLVGSIIWYLESQKPPRLPDGDKIITIMTNEEKERKYPEAREIISPNGFINTPPLTIKEFIGKKIILVDFWTYSCINCQRTTPYLNSWYEKYKDDGFVILGIHSPEFAFEKELSNVRKAVEQFNIKYPVILDNDYGTWRAYGNRHWPHKYLIDIDGYIVYDHIGEGAYEETERKIQELLEERMERLGKEGEIDKAIAVPAGARDVDFRQVKSPEIYFGAARNTYLGNGKSGQVGVQTFSEPTGIKGNILYLVGDWLLDKEFAENQTPEAKIIFHYSAKNVNLVMQASTPVEIEVLIDGKPVTDARGRDLKEENGKSIIIIKDAGLYELINDPTGYGEHTLEIIIKTPGLQVFAFTFG